MTDLEGRISFRKLQAEDFPLMVKWLNAPHVNRIYDKKPMSLEEVQKKYLPRTKEDNKVRSFVLLFDGKPIGHFQTYLVADYPTYASIIQVEGRVGGVDVFIGEPDMVGKGVGSTAIRKFVGEVMFRTMPIDLVVLGPNPSNAPAIKAYEKADFTYLKTVYNPEEKKEEYLMVKRRE